MFFFCAFVGVFGKFLSIFGKVSTLRGAIIINIDHWLHNSRCTNLDLIMTYILVALQPGSQGFTTLAVSHCVQSTGSAIPKPCTSLKDSESDKMTQASN